MVKNLPAMKETRVRSLGREDSRPGGGHSSPLQYSCLENSMDRGAQRATVHGVAKSWTRLGDFSLHYFTSSKSLILVILEREELGSISCVRSISTFMDIFLSITGFAVS